MKAVQDYIKTTLNNNDTLLLGFSAEMKISVVQLRSHILRTLVLQSEHSFAAVRHYENMFNHLP